MDISHRIMTINMNGKGATEKRKEEIISNIKNPQRPSVIFCQELPSQGIMNEVVDEVSGKCGSDNYSYKFASSYKDKNKKIHAAVMWNETDFNNAKEVKCTDVSIEDILQRLEEDTLALYLRWVRERAAMVKLTIDKSSPFLAVSWHGPCKTKGKEQPKTKYYELRAKEHEREPKEHKLEALHVLICFLLEVCEKEALSSFIIGGDFNLNTSEVNLTEYFGLTMLSYNTQHKKGSIPYKDTFIVWVKVGSDKRPLIASSVKPHKSENGSSEASPLDHKPIVGDLKILNKEPSIKQDKAETSTEDKTTNENDIPGLTPEKTPPTAGGSYAPSAQRKLKYEVGPPLQANEGASSSTNGQSPSASHDGYVTKKDFDRLMSLVETLRTSVDSLHKKIDRQTDEIAEIKSAMQRPDIPPRSVSPAQHAGPNSQTSKVLPSPDLDEGSDKESASEIKKKESRIKKK